MVRYKYHHIFTIHSSCFLILVFNLFFNSLFSQSDFYKTDEIQDIKIYFEESNWDSILDSLYIDGNKARHLCRININGEDFDSVGIRYKGFSSVSVDRKKNPFNIKLDYVKNQDYEGFDKIKLSNVIQDPSFLREVLSYDIARKYMPASRANFARVFINDEYWGLYTNVEAVNKDFIPRHYNSKNNAFFKCNPDELDFDGENSNLSNSHGRDTSAYYPYYDIESDYGWGELLELIETLNEDIDNIEEILNVDRTLWMHAFNYALVNMDSYVGYSQNYYLYREDNGRFSPILWDLNQSFGSFRLTDASEHFDGISIEEAKTLDPLLHYSSISIQPRPLMRELFENDTYRRMYIAHLRTIMFENFSNDDLSQNATYLQSVIEEDVKADQNKFYSDQDFYENKDSTVSDLIDYPGLTDLMYDRFEYFKRYPGFYDPIQIVDHTHQPRMLSAGDDVWIRATTLNAGRVVLYYRFKESEAFRFVEMADDGTKNDGLPGDGVFGQVIGDIGTVVEYYVYAENDQAGTFSPLRAAYEYYTITTTHSANNIVINEFMADNETTVPDEADEYDDWIELYNNSQASIALSGMYLSDDLGNLNKWALPDVMMPGQSYYIVWADNDEDQGDHHASFKLSSGGEGIYLSDVFGIIDSVSFGQQETDISMARIPNGVGPFQRSSPTFNQNNSPSATDFDMLEEIKIYPNPSQSQLNLEFDLIEPKKVIVMALNGKVLKAINYSGQSFIETDELIDGLYAIQFIFESSIVTKRFAVQKN